MPQLKILTFPDSADQLRMVAEPVSLEELNSPPVQEFIDALFLTQREAHGAGLAAPQVELPEPFRGTPPRVFTAGFTAVNPRYPYKPLFSPVVVINPEITPLTDDRYESNEGCLSLPGERAVVSRCPFILVTGLNRDGSPLKLLVRGISAGTFLHELDHLEGALIIDSDRALPGSRMTSEEFQSEHLEDFELCVREIEAHYNVDQQDPVTDVSDLSDADLDALIAELKQLLNREN